MVTAALTGAPATMAACAALCANQLGQADSHASHGPATPAVVGHQATHGAAHAHHAVEPTPDEPSPAGSLVSAGRTCCPNCAGTPVVTIAAVRSDAGLWQAAAALALEAPLHAQLPARIAMIQGRLESAPSIGRAPLVLRV